MESKRFVEIVKESMKTFLKKMDIQNVIQQQDD